MSSQSPSPSRWAARREQKDHRLAPDDRVGLLTDVTVRKHVVAKLRGHQNQFELKADERKHTELELLESSEQLRQLSAHMEAVREEERKHIAMEVHDELGQMLTALKMNVSLLEMQLANDSAAMHKVDEMRALVEKTIQIVRNVTSHLRPVALNFGLASALEWLVDDFRRHARISCHLHIQGAEPRFSDARATAIFRIAQESLTNVARHAGASRVKMTISRTGSGVKLRIIDDGRGFDTGEAGAGYSYGLQGMVERARLIDAKLHIESAQYTGTVISIDVAED
ncbi:signal transduction histidine kinase [Paraburkholderia sp. GAS334]